jgi:formylglycine-generating enzyme required for sulfatase activity
MDFVRIDPGTFAMGSPATEPGRGPDEGPQHDVTIGRAFYLCRTEVTQGRWQAVMRTKPWMAYPDVQFAAGNPAVHLSWNDAQALAVALNRLAADSLYRVPPEAEWEYACRAGRTT